jgi:regulator of nucleoside diphosphate kinase
MSLNILITDRDARRLRPLVRAYKGVKGEVHAENLKRLELELDRAQLVMESEIPADVITMNSTVELEDMSDGEVLIYTLVYPENADASKGRISILAPLGTAMLGYRVGDEIEWPVPGGTIRVLIRRLLAPAAPALVTPDANGTVLPEMHKLKG